MIARVWVRFTVPAKDETDAQGVVRRALRTLPLDCGCSEAVVLADPPTPEMLARPPRRPR